MSAYGRLPFVRRQRMSAMSQKQTYGRRGLNGCMGAGSGHSRLYHGAIIPVSEGFAFLQSETGIFLCNTYWWFRYERAVAKPPLTLLLARANSLRPPVKSRSRLFSNSLHLSIGSVCVSTKAGGSIFFSIPGSLPASVKGSSHQDFSWRLRGVLVKVFSAFTVEGAVRIVMSQNRLFESSPDD